MVITFQVNLISGKSFTILLDENKTADDLRKEVFEQWDTTAAKSKLGYLEIKLIIDSQTLDEYNLDVYQRPILDFLDNQGVRNTGNSYKVTATRQKFSEEAKGILTSAYSNEQIIEIFNNLPEAEKKNKSIVLAAAQVNADIFAYVDVEFRADQEIMLRVLRQTGHEFFSTHPMFFGTLPPQNRPIIEYASEALRSDHDFMLKAIRLHPYAYQYASDQLLADRNFMLSVVQRYPNALGRAPYQIRSDRDIVLAAVQQKGEVLFYASNALQADQELVLVAEQQKKRASEYAENQFRKAVVRAFKAYTDYDHPTQPERQRPRMIL